MGNPIPTPRFRPITRWFWNDFQSKIKCNNCIYFITIIFVCGFSKNLALCDDFFNIRAPASLNSVRFPCWISHMFVTCLNSWSICWDFMIIMKVPDGSNFNLLSYIIIPYYESFDFGLHLWKLLVPFTWFWWKSTFIVRSRIRRGKYINKKEQALVFLQTVLAVSYLHNLQIMHG